MALPWTTYPGPRLVHAPAGPFRSRRALLLRRGFQRHGSVRREAARHPVRSIASTSSTPTPCSTAYRLRTAGSRRSRV
ncbi:MAG: hypothetical protein MZU84_08535 [Sphingobacterium sp.]|nr:hypothetical protein [Sphingobacterium sp.]